MSSPPRRNARLDEESALLAVADSDPDEDPGHREDLSLDYDSALEKAGFGRFHFWLTMVCGLANASDAIEILCISFLLPSAECDFKLTSADKGWISAAMFIGMLIGGYFWGGLADIYGRKIVLMGALLLNAISGVVSSLAMTSLYFIILRFVSGIGIGGSIPVTWSYYAEFQPKAVRGKMLSIIATFWMIGNVIVAGLAWIIIPRVIIGSVSDVNISWRIFSGICAGPALITAILITFLPESPKYLLARKGEKPALEVLNYIYEVNNPSNPRAYPVKRLTVDHDGAAFRVRSMWGNIKEVFINTWILVSQKDIRLITYAMLYINFAIAFGYYGLWLWFPELFNKLDIYIKNHPNEEVFMCDVTSFSPPRQDAIDFQVQIDRQSDFDPECLKVLVDSSVFLNSFLISISAMPGNIWTIFHMDVLGRKFFLVLSMVLSGLSAFLIYMVKSQTTNLLVSCLFGAVSTMGFNALDCLMAELFPTGLRSSAMGTTLAAGRLGAILANIVFGYLINLNCAVPILSVAVLLISGGLVGLLLPNTTRTALA